MNTLLFSRLRLPTLLLSAVVPCLAASRAAGGGLSSFDQAQVAPAALVQPQAVSPGPFVDAPGTPYPFANPGGTTIIIGYNASSAQPTSVSTSNSFDITNVVAGDVVMLRDPAGTDDPSNWTAVFRFLNLNDPTGADGLPADEVEGFDPTNTGLGGFGGFQLVPNTIYLADTPNSSASHLALTEEFGPDQGILGGQVATLGYVVSVADSVGTGPGGGGSSVPEPATFLLIGLGGCALIAERLRRRGCAQT